MPLISTLVFTASATAWSAARAPMTALRPGGGAVRVRDDGDAVASATAVVSRMASGRRLDYTAFEEITNGERPPTTRARTPTISTR